jgi:hypothetical protein
MSEPDYVRILRSGAEPTDDPASPHPLILDDIDAQVREMERARAEALVSGRDYLMSGGEPT